MELLNNNFLVFLLILIIIAVVLASLLGGGFRRHGYGFFQNHHGGYNGYGPAYGHPPYPSPYGGYPQPYPYPPENGLGSLLAALGIGAFLLLVIGQARRDQPVIDQEELSSNFPRVDYRHGPPKTAAAQLPPGPGRLEQEADRRRPDYSADFGHIDLDPAPGIEPATEQAPNPALPNLIQESLNDKFFLQIGAFSMETAAVERLQQSAAKHSLRSFLGVTEGGYAMGIKALIGPFDSLRQAQRALRNFPGMKGFVKEGKELQLKELFIP